MVETNIEIKLKEEFPAGINVVNEIEGDNDDVAKEESYSVCGKDRYKYEEETDGATGNKEIEQANTDIAVYEGITFWPQTCSGQLLADLVTLGPKKFQNKDELFTLTVEPWKNSPRVLLQHWFYKTMENGETIFSPRLLYSKMNKSLNCFCCRFFLKTEQHK